MFEFVLLMVLLHSPFLLALVFLLRQIHLMMREAQRWRSRAWWLAVPFHLLWLPAWYGVLATASHRPDYNPEILQFNDFNDTWLLSALAAQTLMVLVLWRRHKRGCQKAASHIFAFVLTGCLVVLLSYWWAQGLYAPLYRWWWQPVLASAGIQGNETLYALNHTAYSTSSYMYYLLASSFFTLASNLCCYLIRKRPKKDNQ